MKKFLKKFILKKTADDKKKEKIPRMQGVEYFSLLSYNVLNKFLPIKTWVKMYKIISDFEANFQESDYLCK